MYKALKYKREFVQHFLVEALPVSFSRLRFGENRLIDEFSDGLLQCAVILASF